MYRARTMRAALLQRVADDKVRLLRFLYCWV
jgi:hypothetical protein